jgi:hypothetical protein
LRFSAKTTLERYSVDHCFPGSLFPWVSRRRHFVEKRFIKKEEVVSGIF